MTNTVNIPDYHQFAFRSLYCSHNALISKKYLEMPREFLFGRISKHFKTEATLTPDEAHQALSRVLSEIESEFQRVVSKHSCFYWIHLYRRIRPYLPDQMGNNTDAITLAWVRGIAEQAIYKFAKTKSINDVALAKTIHPKNILGGYFLKAAKKILHKNPDFANFYTQAIANSSQWVLKDFRPTDLAIIYYIEGLAYQYWYVNAKQRAAGKGISIQIVASGELRELRTPEQEDLITSFDIRLGTDQYGLPTNVGTYVRPTEAQEGRSLVFVSINAQQQQLEGLFAENILDAETKEPFSPNYLPSYLDMAEYYVSHKYLEPSFEKKHGFGLKQFCLVAYAISAILISASPLSDDAKEDLYIHDLVNKLQRGYLFSGLSTSSLKDMALAFLQESKVDDVFNGCDVTEQIDSILSYLTLDEKKQNTIGIWSMGPRYVLIPYQDFYFYDLSAWLQVFRNLFYGLRNYDPRNQKGKLFESTYADFARQSGLDVVLESTEIIVGDQPRELDVAIRVENCLFVCECRASERPLDFEIGNPKTIKARCDDLQQKNIQVTSLVALLRQNPKGKGYDFSWATEMVPIVVSPYTEWIWSFDNDLWISKDQGIPRILSASEAIEFIKAYATPSVSA